MPLRNLIRDRRVIDGLSVTAGALLALAFYALADFRPIQQPECASVPYALGDKPTCMEISK